MTAARVRIGIAVFVVAALAAGVWWWSTRNRESTDAQVDAGVTPIAARVGGTVVAVPIVDNQHLVIVCQFAKCLESNHHKTGYGSPIVVGGKEDGNAFGFFSPSNHVCSSDKIRLFS